MIGFAQPLALFALLSLPIIIVLHSLRPTRRSVLLSSTALWREALRERRRGLGLEKLLRNLSLVLLLLFALLASLALGEPQWLTRSADHGHLVLVLDTSASMQAREQDASRFELARREAAALIDSLPASASLLLMSSGREPLLRTAFENDKDVLRRALAGIEVSDEAGRPQAALTLALSLLRNRERGRVVFLTDGAYDERADFGAGEIDVRLFGGPADNVAITRFDARPELGSDERFQVLITVASHATRAMTLPLRITLDEALLMEQAVELVPGESRTLVWPFRGRASGRLSASIEVDDALAVDNQAFAVMGGDETLRILLLGTDTFYLRSALGALPGVVLTQREAVPEVGLEPLLPQYDVLVIQGLPAPLLPEGSYLLVDSVPPGMPFSDSGRVTNPVVAGRGASALLEQVDLGALRIEEARRIDIDAGAADLQRLFWSSQSVLALAGIDRQRRFVYLGFDPAKSSFPLQAAFPLFIRQSVEWLRPRELRDAGAQVAAGARYTIGVPVGTREVIVRGPDNVAEVHAVTGGELVFDRSSRAGIYQYTLDRESALVQRYFAVNPGDERESAITPRVTPVADGVVAADAAEQGQVTLALWPHLLATALLVLMLEWCLVLLRRRHA